MAVTTSPNLAASVPLFSYGNVGPSAAEHVRDRRCLHDDRVCCVVPSGRPKREGTRKGQSDAGSAQ